MINTNMIPSILSDLPDEDYIPPSSIQPKTASKFTDNKKEAKPINNSLSLSSPQNPLPDSKDELYIMYIKETRIAFESLKNKNYSNAQSNYSTAYEIANKLKDDPKAIEALCNCSICQYFNGQFFKSLTILQSALQLYSQLPQISLPLLPKIHLGIKLHINLLNAHLINANGVEAVSQIDSIIGLIEKEPKAKKQHSLIKGVIFNLFRVDTLTKNGFTLDSSDNDNDHLKIIYNILKGFHLFLKENNYDNLVKCFKEAAENYQELKDTNGYYFALFYQYATKATSGEDKNQLNEMKNKILLCNKYLIGSDTGIKEKSVDIVLKEFDKKLEASVEIYKKLSQFEKEILENQKEDNEDNHINHLNKSDLGRSIDKSHLFTNERISSPIFIKLLLRFSLNYMENDYWNEDPQFIKAATDEINNVLLKITQNEIDISSVKLSSLDPDISNSLKLLFDNIIFIYYKQKLRNSLMHYKTKIENLKRTELAKKCSKYLEENYQLIRLNTKLTKVNFTSNGTKNHYYKVDALSECFQIRNKENDKVPSASLSLRTEITKIAYGITSSNVKRKLVKSDLPQNLNEMPWKFLSVCTRERSIDLFLTEEQLENWFYGLTYYLSNIDSHFKIISCSKFIITKSKWKIIRELKRGLRKNTIKADNDKSLARSLSLEKGIQNFSFVKLVLLFNKVCKSPSKSMVKDEEENNENDDS